VKGTKVKKEEIVVIVVQPGKGAVPQTIKNTLSAMQSLVGGLIERVPSRMVPQLTDLGVHVYVNENGKLENLAPNKFVRGDILLGPMVLSMADEEGDEIGFDPASGEILIGVCAIVNAMEPVPAP
jgi:hypothetical protein